MYDQKPGTWMPPGQSASMRNAYQTYARLNAPQTNGFATAGLILGILPCGLLGVIFSILGLVRASAVGGVGRIKSTIGLILSVLWIGAVVAVGIVAENSATVRNAVAARLDAGCVAIESHFSTLATGVSAAKTTNGKVAALQSIIDELKADEAKTQRPEAKAAMQKYRKDLTQLQSDLRKGRADPGLDTKIRTDGAAIDTACR